MRTTVSKRGRTAVPANIRQKYKIIAQSKLEWIDEGEIITVIPIAKDIILVYRGKSKGQKLVEQLLEERKRERRLERKLDGR